MGPLACGWSFTRRFRFMCFPKADLVPLHHEGNKRPSVISLLTGAAGIAGDDLCEGREKLRDRGFPWEADHLYFTVREPFPSQATQTSLVFGKVDERASLRIVSQMAGNGVIFSDWVVADFLEFNSGVTATVGVAERSGLIVT